MLLLGVLLGDGVRHGKEDITRKTRPNGSGKDVCVNVLCLFVLCHFQALKKEI